MINNVTDPTSCNIYTTAGKRDKKRNCPTISLVDVQAEIKRSLMVSFTFANPDDNYKVLLEEGSSNIWEIDYVKDGKLEKVAGKVDNFEFWTNKHYGISTYLANGIIQKDSKIVVRFDCSMDFRKKLVAIDLHNIRRLRPLGAVDESEIVQDSDSNTIKLSKNAYNFIKNYFPTEFRNITELGKTLNTDIVEYTDSMFEGALSLNKLDALDLTKVKSAKHMFRDCSNLPQVIMLTSDKLMDAEGMFYGCTKLNNVELDTSGLQNGKEMFHNCRSLQHLKLNVDKLTNTADMFLGCTRLEDLRFDGKLHTAMNLQDCPLNQDSIKSILESLSLSGPDENKVLRFRPTTMDGSLEPLAAAATKAGWDIRGLSFNRDEEVEDISIDILAHYNMGKRGQ